MQESIKGYFTQSPRVGEERTYGIAELVSKSGRQFHDALIYGAGWPPRGVHGLWGRGGREAGARARGRGGLEGAGWRGERGGKRKAPN